MQVDGKRIREWRSQKEVLEQLYDDGQKKRLRLDGAGRKIKSDQLEQRLREWISSQRESRLRVSRKMIQKKALEWYREENQDNEFTASNGWLEKFLERNGFVLRRKTTVSQKLPRDCMEKIISFILYIRKIRIQNRYKDNCIFCMDETPVWIEPIANTTLDKKGQREVPIKSTGHEKVRITVILTAKADGKKCKPFIVIPRKREIKELQGLRDVVCAYASKFGWTMNLRLII